MQFAAFFSIVGISFLAQPALAQRVEPVNSLGRARSTYDASDTNRDGKVTIEEFARQKLTIQKADFDAMDVDKNGAWSRDEFLVYYRRILINSGQRAADDLEAEVARIQAARRAKAADAGPKRPAVTPDAAARLRTAIDDLEKKDALRQAKHEDFQRVKDGMVECVRQITAQDPATGAELLSKFDSAVDALEVKARAGKYDRADYTALRESLVARARGAAATTPANATPPAPTPAAAAAPLTTEQLQSALETALDDLGNKAEARNATRDDYTRVKEAFIARARAAAPGTDAATVTERGTLEQRFIAAIDKLEVDAREGRYTRAEFQAVRDTYIARVRAITSSTPANTANPAPAATGDLAGALDAALDDLGKKAEARQATREDFNRVREAMIARARSLTASDPAAAGRLGTLDEAFTKAMDKLEADALAGKYSREDFTALRDGYVSRARAIVAAGAVAAQPASPAANSPVPAGTPEASSGTIEQRFDQALNELERKALSRGATREDFQRVTNLMTERARAAVQTQAGAPIAEGDPRIATLSTALQNAMARLESAAASGGLNSADFANLRQMLITRARDAVQPPAPTPTPAPEVKPPDNPPTTRTPDPKPADAKPADPKPTEPAKPAEPAPGRSRPAPEPKPEQPKPADPPKEGRPVPPPTPPHRG